MMQEVPGLRDYGHLRAGAIRVGGVLYAGYEEPIRMKAASGRDEDLRDIGRSKRLAGRNVGANQVSREAAVLGFMEVARPLLILVLSAIIPAGSALAQPGVSYQIPPDNPFVERSGADEIYAYGLRNPFRFSFDRETGDFFIGDVGQGAREEIDWIDAKAAAGANFGWACREGKEPGPKHATAECLGVHPVEPLFDYSQSGPQAVTGGVLVRDPQLASLRGRYLYTDFFTGDIRSLRPDFSAPDDTTTGLTRSDVSSFGEDAAGRAYVTDLVDNQVLRLHASGSPGTLAEQPLAGSFAGPVAVTGVPGDPSRLLVAEKAGTLRIVVDGAALSDPFLDVHPFGLISDDERGLLGVAAAPDYASSGKIYVYYTDGEGDIRIDEFRRSASNPNVADPSTRRLVLEVPHRFAGNHKGGTVMFGPDRCLWTAIGDGGGSNDQFNQSQNLETLLGKLLRIDPDPPGQGGPVCSFSDSPPFDPDANPGLFGEGSALRLPSMADQLPAGSTDVAPPRLRARIPRRQRVLRLRGVAAYALCSEPCGVSIGGRVKLADRRIELLRETRLTTAKRWLRLHLRLTRRAEQAVRGALRRGLDPNLRVGLRARDAAGNRSRLVRVTVKTRPSAPR